MATAVILYFIYEMFFGNGWLGMYYIYYVYIFPMKIFLQTVFKRLTVSQIASTNKTKLFSVLGKKIFREFFRENVK